MKFKTFLANEAVLHFLDKDELQTAQEILDTIKSLNLMKLRCRYRGFSGGQKNNGIAEVTNKRSGFYGGLNATGRILVKDYLGVKYPTFVAMDREKASFFGPVFVYVPFKKSTHHQSAVIQDLVTDLPLEAPTDPDYFADMKKSYDTGGLGDLRYPNSEIIADAEKYYLIQYTKLTESFRSKFFNPVKDDKTLTYGDIYNAVKAYISYSKYMIKIGKKRSFDDEIDRNLKQQIITQKNAEERYSKKNREMRKKIIEADAKKKSWDISFSLVPEQHKMVKTDGKAYLITCKYIKTKKEIWKYYTNLGLKYRNGEQAADKVVDFISRFGVDKKDLLLF